MKAMLLIAFGFSWTALWWTADQQGQRLFQRKEYENAAKVFADPQWQGAAWYRAGNYKKAAQAFAIGSTPEALFNEGNAWMLQGQYPFAVDRYDKALKMRPKWKEAQDNRDLAAARAKLLNRQGGDAGDQTIGADKIVFDKKKPGGQNTDVAGEEAATDAVVQSMWLRRVQTKPADFLKSKFAYQLSIESEGTKR